MTGGGEGGAICFTNKQDIGLKEGGEGLGEGGMGGGREEGGGSGGSVGLDLTNDVEAHSSRSPVTPRIAGQAGQYHHVQRKSLSGKDFRVGHSLLAWICKRTLASVRLLCQDI